MPTTQTAPTLHLITGLPGAGKTTRARRVLAETGGVLLSPDDWLARLNISLVDYEFRFRLQDCLLSHAGDLLRAGVDVVIEFGSWSRAERETIRLVAVDAGAKTTLHFADAPVPELARRVRARGGSDAEALAELLETTWQNYERPTQEEIDGFDNFEGPTTAWLA